MEPTGTAHRAEIKRLLGEIRLRGFCVIIKCFIAKESHRISRFAQAGSFYGRYEHMFDGIKLLIKRWTGRYWKIGFYNGDSLLQANMKRVCRKSFIEMIDSAALCQGITESFLINLWGNNRQWADWDQIRVRINFWVRNMDSLPWQRQRYNLAMKNEQTSAKLQGSQLTELFSSNIWQDGRLWPIFQVERTVGYQGIWRSLHAWSLTQQNPSLGRWELWFNAGRRSQHLVSPGC